ncbi:MAG: hypothetical protein FWJ92_01245 [Actinomycetes bacterium]|jgi:hypothetical protein|nr:hypothetical protein [Acidimicrobiia bacterium]
MRLAVVLVLLAASAGPQFVSPQARGEVTADATMEVELTVTLSGSDGPVAVHLLLPGEEPEVRPLLDRGGGVWGSVLRLRQADWRVVFEDVSSGVLSEEMSLSGIGLDPAVLGVSPPATEAAGGSVPPPALAAAVAAVAVMALAAVAFRLTPRPGPPPPRRPRSGRS